MLVAHGDHPTIYIQYSSTPIAPITNGGWETTNWSDSNKKSFPIQMIDDVDIIGIPQAGTGAKPRVLIDESVTFGLYDGWEGPPSTTSAVRTFFIAASQCTLKNLEIDGTPLELNCQAFPSDPSKCKPVSAVWAVEKLEFDVVDCQIHGMHDGVIYNAPSGTAQNPTTATGTVSGCEF